MADYYVDNTVANSSTYDPITRTIGSGTEQVYSNIRDGEDTLGEGDVLYVMPGTYTNASNENRVYSTVNNISILAYDFDDKPIIDASQLLFDCFNIEGNNCTIGGFVLKDLANDGEHAIQTYHAENLYVFDVEIDNCGKPDDDNARPIYIIGSTGDGIRFDRIWIHGNTQDKQLIRTGNVTGGGVTINYSVLDGEGMCNYLIHWDKPLDLTINNSYLLNFNKIGIFSTYIGVATSTITVKNSIILPESSIYDTIVYGVYITDANTSLSMSNSLVSAGIKSSSVAWNATTQSVSNMLTNAPGFQSYGKNNGIVAITFDWDNYSAQSMKDIADVFHSKGLSCTFVVNQVFFMLPSFSQDPDDILYCHNKGIDIGSHGFSHSSLGTGVQDVMNIQYIGAGGVCTMSIDGDSLTTNTAGNGEDLDIDLTIYSDVSTALLSSLITLINNKSDYTCSLIDSGVVPSTVQATSLESISDQDITTEYAVKTDASRFFTNEIIGNTSWVESITGVDCISYAYASNSLSSESKAFMQNLDGTSSGQKIKIVSGDSVADASDNYDLSDYDLIHGLRWSSLTEIRDIEAIDEITADELKIMFFRDVGIDAYSHGYVFHLYFHANDFGSDGLTELEKTALGNYFEALVATGVKVMSMREAYEEIVTNSTFNEITGRYERTLTDVQDIRLVSTSPCINAGTPIPSIADETDPWGSTVKVLPNIGADQSWFKDGMQIISGDQKSEVVAFDGSFGPDTIIGFGKSDMPIAHDMTKILKQIKSWSK